MIGEYEWEPVRGLPERLPNGEEIVWQVSPDWRAVASSVLHIRYAAAWFVVVAAFAFVAGGTGPTGALITLAVGLLGCGVIAFLAWAQARTTVYTLTQRRLVLRFGVALTKCVNLPLAMIERADAKPAGAHHHDVALQTIERFPLAYIQMWPHVRPGKFARPVPMLRGIDGKTLASLAAALSAVTPARPVAAERPAQAAAPVPASVGVAA